MKWNENNMSLAYQCHKVILKKKKRNSWWPIDPIAHNALGLWCFLQKMAANKIRNGDWKQNQTLKIDLSRYVRQNWEKSEILEPKYPICAWSERTLTPMLQYFDIKFTDELWNGYWRCKRSCQTRNGTCSLVLYWQLHCNTFL